MRLISNSVAAAYIGVDPKKLKRAVLLGQVKPSGRDKHGEPGWTFRELDKAIRFFTARGKKKRSIRRRRKIEKRQCKSTIHNSDGSVTITYH